MAGRVMANYDFAQMEQLWINAGGAKNLAPLAAAIGTVESGGDPQASNSIGASGIWQLIPSNWHFIPGGEANRFNPSDNAIGAVRLSGNTLGGLISNWIDSETPGAAYAVLKQHGGTPPSGSLPADTGTPASGGSGSTGTATAQSAQLSSAWSSLGSDIIDPFKSIADSLGTVITSPADIATSVTRLAKDFNSLVGLFNTFLKDIEWLFVPSHWVRIFAFMFGSTTLLAGIWAIMRSQGAGPGLPGGVSAVGQPGDITLALGILLITVAGVLLFIAFHNLPSTVTDLQGLLAYISQGIRQGSAPTTVPTPQQGQLADLGPGTLPG